MKQFRVLPAKPDLQQLVRKENPQTPFPVSGKPHLWQEEATLEHKEIFKCFKDDHSVEIVKMAKREGHVHLETLSYGPYRFCGHFVSPSDSVVAFIPLKNADGADASSPKVWNQADRQKPERVIWQIESPFRIPASGFLYIEDFNVRFLMLEYRFKSQPAADGDGEETQTAVDGDEGTQPAPDVARAEARMKYL
ncbi:hypothetical protein LZ32DRAFT_611495 [Colletotrichum eremochloae]|nr:hypothetical protein LZ32DRAFT_611495 [Colletotrichum eremochloae]